MDPDRWKRVRAALEDVLSLAAGEREAALAAALKDDDELLREARKLLAHADQPPSFGAPPGVRSALGEGAFAPEESEEPDLGLRVGSYELGAKIAAGGMGAVYHAKRVDQEFTKEVAVKLIKRGMDTGEVLERFRHERQVLAGLEHPGIARLIDGGATADGRPFLVMEYVDGQPIDRFCDDAILDVAARVRLVRDVCDAVQHAHSALVVHRDLKPSNILVTPDGQPKLLDFGIAKMLGPRDAELTVDSEARFYTPEYASPEQVSGAAITTASDVYSLGVVLYRILTGRHPQSFTTRSSQEIVEIVCELMPERPSSVVTKTIEPPTETVGRAPEPPAEIARRRATSAVGLRRALIGDLDTIVMKALRKEPQRRYASVRELSDDLGRYLDGFPVLARPDALGYRVGKYCRRNAWALAAALLVLTSLTVGLVVSRHQYQEAERARIAEAEQKQLAQQRGDELAATNRELVRQREIADARSADVRSFSTALIFDLYGAIYRLGGATEATRLVVTLGTDFLDKLASDTTDDIKLQSEVAEAYMRLGNTLGSRVQANAGQHQDALAAFEKAEALCRRIVATAPAERHHYVRLAQAALMVGDGLNETGRVAESYRVYDEALESLGDAALQDPNAVDDRELYVSAILLDRMIVADLEAPRLEEAADKAAAMIELMEELVLRKPNDAQMSLEFASAYFRFAELGLASRDWEAASERGSESARIARAVLELQPNWSPARRAVAAGLLAVGQAQGELGRAEEALAALAEAREHFEQCLAAEPGNRFLERELVAVARTEANVQRAAGNADGWIVACERELALAAELRRAAPNAWQFLEDEMRARTELGRALTSRAPSEAVAHFEVALDLADAVLDLVSERDVVRRLRAVLFSDLGRAYEIRAERASGATERRADFGRARDFALESEAALDSLGQLSESEERLIDELGERIRACAAKLAE